MESDGQKLINNNTYSFFNRKKSLRLSFKRRRVCPEPIKGIHTTDGSMNSEQISGGRNETVISAPVQLSSQFYPTSVSHGNSNGKHHRRITTKVPCINSNKTTKNSVVTCNSADGNVINTVSVPNFMTEDVLNSDNTKLITALPVINSRKITDKNNHFEAFDDNKSVTNKPKSIKDHFPSFDVCNKNQNVNEHSELNRKSSFLVKSVKEITVKTVHTEYVEENKENNTFIENRKNFQIKNEKQYRSFVRNDNRFSNCNIRKAEKVLGENIVTKSTCSEVYFKCVTNSNFDDSDNNSVDNDKYKFKCYSDDETKSLDHNVDQNLNLDQQNLHKSSLEIFGDIDENFLNDYQRNLLEKVNSSEILNRTFETNGFCPDQNYEHIYNDEVINSNDQQNNSYSYENKGFRESLACLPSVEVNLNTVLDFKFENIGEKHENIIKDELPVNDFVYTNSLIDDDDDDDDDDYDYDYHYDDIICSKTILQSILVDKTNTNLDYLNRKRKSVHFSNDVSVSDGDLVKKQKIKNCDSEIVNEYSNECYFPVVSLYSSPVRKPKSNKSDNYTNRIKHTSKMQTNAQSLSKIVKRLGPEVLTATNSTDSVLAQIMKTQHHQQNQLQLNKLFQYQNPVQRQQNSSEDQFPTQVRRPNLKRKANGDIYESSGSTEEMYPGPVAGSRKKLPRMDIHLHALFAAVEHGQTDKARAILESTDVDVNSVNSDGLSPLDVAVLSNNRSLTKTLIAFGAQEGNKYDSAEKLSLHLRQLACEAERRVQELSETDNKSYSQNVSDKTLTLWERRARGLNRMILGFDQARPPDIPFLVVVDVTGTDSVTVRYQEPSSVSDLHDAPACTKYKVEWSCDREFNEISGFKEILDPRQLECHIDGLEHGKRYYFRVACGNIRGYGSFRRSYPDSVTPSSWRDVQQKDERLPNGGLTMLDRLFNEVRSARPDLKGLNSPCGPGETPLGQRRKKTTIKQLFTAASKFQKHLRRGVYLSCLLYHEDKVLVTNEDFLPVIEVDETYPGSIYHDFHWLLKVACTWDDVKWLRQDMEKSLSSSAVHFRIKLLQAAAQMQTALSIQDLGQLYHKPLKDTEGTIVVCTVNYVKSPKTVSVLNSRWMPLSKLTKRNIQPSSDAPISDILIQSVQDQITYHQVSSIRLPRGLYLGYLKMRSSVDLLQVLVPTKSPNVPPHCKIRDNPHITAEEWECLRAGVSSSGNNETAVTEQQRVFLEQVAATARRLFTYMQVSCEEAPSHRLYDGEVVELSSDVSFLIVVPPPESACAAPGQRDLLLQRPDLLPLPVQVFEMVHLGTYQKQLVSRYSRLSCILELDTALAQHSHREAFSSIEVCVARERLARLEGLQAQLNAAWKAARWLLDVLAFARDRLTHSPTCMRHLLQKRSRDHLSESQNGVCLLQPPDAKAVKSRGSWPGPGVARLLGTCTAEMSRSDQHLSIASPTTLTQNTSITTTMTVTRPPPPPLPPQRPSAPLPPSPQKSPPQPPTTINNNAKDIMRLPPSRSEDTLLLHSRGVQSHARTRFSVSATTSPLLPTRPGGYCSGSLHSSSEESGLLIGNQSNKSDVDVEEAEEEEAEGEEGATVPAPAPGILQVYAAYETGLGSGTSLKLHVSPRTSAREVVDLVVKQLNMAVVLKGKEGPIYAADQLTNFCLVAVIGARERCLRDDFKPLQLQNPWKKGRLYVRQKHDVLAALEHSSRHSALL